MKEKFEMVQEILRAKEDAGNDSHLWLHDSGDCILWPTEESSVNDAGRNAIGRWHLSHEEQDALIETGGVDEVA